MNIQTAGEQKYYDLIQERSKQIRTVMIVWSSLLAAALIAFTANPKVGIILAVIGAALAFLNVKSRKELNAALDAIKDREEFFCQLTDPGTVDVPEYGLIITKNYVLKYHQPIAAYEFADMEKVEVGIQGTIKKVLFLTEKTGERHALAESTKDREAFDQVYLIIKERVCRGGTA